MGWWAGVSRVHHSGIGGLGVRFRRRLQFGIGTIAGVAAKFGVHRRVVRRAIAGALPPTQHYPERTKPKLGGRDGSVHGVPLGRDPDEFAAALRHIKELDAAVPSVPTVMKCFA